MAIATNRKINFIFIFTLLFGALAIVSLLKLILKSSTNSLSRTSVTKTSKWTKNKLVIIPAIYNEIDWNNPSSWPLWIREGLDLFNKNTSRLYDIHLYQRLDPHSKAPYNWPYSPNVHEESGVYLKFIYDYYYDLPDKMLFVHSKPNHHSLYPIEAAQCIREDVYYTSVNDLWIQNRPWTSEIRDPTDNVTLMYKCAKRLLTLFGFDAEAQLNVNNTIPYDHNVISTMCCAQFYVRKERILHYTYEQWSSIYNASLQPYCATIHDREFPGGIGLKWFGGSLEYLWHVILGLHSTNMSPPRAKTNTDLCHLFRPLCKGTLCSDVPVKVLAYSIK